MVHCRYSSLTFGLVLKLQFHSAILTSFPLSRLMRSMLLNWKNWTDSAAIFVNFATYHGTILLSHRIFGQTLRGFLPNSPLLFSPDSPLFSNLPLLKGSFLTFHRILTKPMANFCHACSSPHSPSYYFFLILLTKFCQICQFRCCVNFWT